MDNITEMIKGILEGCILKIIKNEETYGYVITKTLQDLGFNEIVEGTVYTVLLRLERNGLVEFTKKESSLGPKRKFYKLTDEGEKELELFWNKLDYVNDKVKKVREL
ncbi:MAG: PadR family transcriptional regulator [Anaeroplasmataceae bacterium]